MLKSCGTTRAIGFARFSIYVNLLFARSHEWEQQLTSNYRPMGLRVVGLKGFQDTSGAEGVINPEP